MSKHIMTNKIFHLTILLFSLLLIAGTAFGQSKKWQLQKAPLVSRFAKKVNPNHVLPHYPRPQMKRYHWLNLNGLWKFQPGNKKSHSIPQRGWNQSILVPFPVESALSGIRKHYFTIWYQRSFKIPKSWKGKKVLLHFGAVDFESEVFVNGKKIGTHQGGYNPFTFDITSALKGNGKQKITVRVYDPTNKKGYPRGKQTLHPGGIMYTSTTGIWKTAWLEPVPKTYIKHIRIIPNIDRSTVKVKADITGLCSNSQVVIKLKKSNGTVIQSSKGAANQFISVVVPHEKLWSPSHPYLYGLDIMLKKDGKTVDKVSSYVGMRKIAIQKVDGMPKIFLNNHFLFEIGPLDQGFWPAGVYTPPSDKAIQFDLGMIKKFGFNMVRKHLKVEPQRWYYWADKLGLLVWQDMPSENSYTRHPQPLQKQAYKKELTRMVKTHWNHPSIIMWDIFNEGQGQFDTKQLVQQVGALDPTRLVNQASGGKYAGVGDVYDIHSYPAPDIPAKHQKNKALVLGEYGGITYKIKGHQWTKKGHGYIPAQNKKQYDQLYTQYANQLITEKTQDGLSAAVYTQLTDVESEINGLMTYDRLIKGSVKKIRAANQKVIHDKVSFKSLLPTSQKNGRMWKYTFKKPSSKRWYKPSFDPGNWKKGKGGFGTKGTPGAVVRTKWSTPDIWLRQSFTLRHISSKEKQNVVLKIHHDEDSQVYINGVKAADLKGYNNRYGYVPISRQAKKALKNGKNIIAIHTHQTKGGQYIDAGISKRHFYKTKSDSNVLSKSK